MSPRHHGNTVIETVLVLTVLIYVGFGAVEFSHYFYVKQVVQGAAREGARAAIVAGAAKTDVSRAVGESMKAAGFSDTQYTLSLTPPDLSSATEGASVSVTVKANWGVVGLRPWGFIPAGKQVTGTTVMRKEG